MNGPDRLPYRSLLLAGLLALPASAAAAADPNRDLLASMIAGQGVGAGCLPVDLGLGAGHYAQLLAEYFPGYDLCAPQRGAGEIPAYFPELDDLKKLLQDHRAKALDSELWLADIVATACAGADHLWQDLGLSNRDELTRLMWINFPALAGDNTSDMKWKKFLYRRFCSTEGIYVCPAPSCGQCQDHAKCFGPEEA